MKKGRLSLDYPEKREPGGLSSYRFGMKEMKI